jgi:hypothetical protein
LPEGETPASPTIASLHKLAPYESPIGQKGNPLNYKSAKVVLGNFMALWPKLSKQDAHNDDSVQLKVFSLLHSRCVIGGRCRRKNK